MLVVFMMNFMKITIIIILIGCILENDCQSFKGILRFLNIYLNWLSEQNEKVCVFQGG